MLDINDLMEMFEDADTYGVDTVSLTIRSRKGTKIELMMCQPIIDPKELAKPEEKKDPEKVKLTDEEVKTALEVADKIQKLSRKEE